MGMTPIDASEPVGFGDGRAKSLCRDEAKVLADLLSVAIMRGIHRGWQFPSHSRDN